MPFPFLFSELSRSTKSFYYGGSQSIAREKLCKLLGTQVISSLARHTLNTSTSQSNLTKTALSFVPQRKTESRSLAKTVVLGTIRRVDRAGRRL
jgi:hypothetical protein